MILKTSIITTDTTLVQVCLGNVRAPTLGDGAIPPISSSMQTTPGSTIIDLDTLVIQQIHPKKDTF